MAENLSVQALRLAHVFLISLLPWRTWADPSFVCPDFVANHAPLIRLHSDDPYKPSDLLAHIRHSTPYLDGQPIPDLPLLDLDNLEILNQYGDQVALTANDDPTTYPKWLLGVAPDASGQLDDATPCIVILVEKSDVDIDAFYFYFYSYNEGPNITQVLEPLNRVVSTPNTEAGVHFGDHVGDWEHNMIRFRNGKPVGIYFSQHRDGKAYDWDDPVLSKTDGRPIVYSARGTHANYPAPGDHLHDIVIVDYCDAGQKWDPILSAYFYRFDPATFTLTRLAPANQSASPLPASNLTSFFYFTGHWGDIRYPDSDPRQETIPQFGVKRFETGPTGPRFKHLVRNGLMPDQRRKQTWTEWGVRIYMTFYPCCLKGWRAWISLGFVVVALVVIVTGVVFGIRRYRNRAGAYRKLQEEQILLDDWQMEEEALLSSSDEGGEENDS